MSETCRISYIDDYKEKKIQNLLRCIERDTDIYNELVSIEYQIDLVHRKELIEVMFEMNLERIAREEIYITSPMIAVKKAYEYREELKETNKKVIEVKHELKKSVPRFAAVFVLINLVVFFLSFLDWFRFKLSGQFILNPFISFLIAFGTLALVITGIVGIIDRGRHIGKKG